MFLDVLAMTGGTLDLKAATTLQFAGYTNWTGGTIGGQSTAILQNTGSGVFVMNAASNLTIGTFLNAGLLLKSVNTSDINATNFANSGQIIVEGGTLRIKGSGTHTGLFRGAGGWIEFIEPGTHVFQTGASTEGNVSFQSGVNATFAAGSNLAGDAEIAAGSNVNVTNGGQVSGVARVKANGTAQMSSGSTMSGGRIITDGLNGIVTIKGGANVGGGHLEAKNNARIKVEAGVLGTAVELRLASGAKLEDGTLSVDTLIWSGGDILGTVLADGGTIDSGSAHRLGGQLTNTGTLQWTSLNTDIDGAGGTFVNSAGASLLIQNARSHLSGSFQNQGTILKTSIDTTYLARSIAGSNPSFSNSGVIDVQAGVLEIGGGGTHTGTAGTSVSGLLIFKPEGAFSTNTFTSGSLTGNIIFGAGTNIISGAAIDGSKFSLRPSTTLHINTGHTGVAESFSMAGGWLDGSGTFRTRNLTWSAGIQQGTGKTVLLQNGIWETGAPLELRRNFDNLGTLLISGAGQTILTQNSATILNEEGASLEFRGEQKIIDGNVTNLGTLLKTQFGDATLLEFGVQSSRTFTNDGAVIVEGGNLVVRAAGSHLGSFTVADGAKIRWSTSNTTPVHFQSGSSLSGANAFLAGNHQVHSGANVEGAKLHIYEALAPGILLDSGVRLTIDSGVTGIADALSMENGFLDGAGTLHVRFLDWSAGEMMGNGTLITDGGVIRASAFNKRLHRTLINASGTLTWQGGSPIFMNTSGQLNNLSGAVFAVGNSGVLYDGNISNMGTLLRTGTGIATLGRHQLSGSDSFSNGGTIRVTGGGVLAIEALNFSNFTGATLSGGSFVVESNSQFRFTGAAGLQNNSANITLEGVNAAITDLIGANALNGLRNNSGSIIVRNGATMNVSPGPGFIGNSGTMLIENSTVVIDDDIGNSGTMLIGNSGTLTVNGAYTQTGGSALTQVNGTLTATGGVTISGGLLRGQGSIGKEFVPTSVTMNTSARISGGETVGTLSIIGNFSQNSGSDLFAEIQSVSAFDKIAVTGNIALSGTLTIDLLEGFALPSNAALDLVTFTGSRTGSFSNIVGLSEGLKIVYLSHAIQLRSLQTFGNSDGSDGMVPEPSMIVVWSIGGLGFLIRMKRVAQASRQK